MIAMMMLWDGQNDVLMVGALGCTRHAHMCRVCVRVICTRTSRKTLDTHTHTAGNNKFTHGRNVEHVGHTSKHNKHARRR